MKRKAAGTSVGTLILIVVILILRARLGLGEPNTSETPARPGSTASPAGTAPTATSDDALIERLFREERSDEIVTAAGRVAKTLPDDNDGSRHQRFIVELATGRTLLIAHNIDLAPRVPLREGDRVTVHGEYEWSERGGVLHWTHHDPGNRHESGWIEHAGKRYE